MCAYVSKFAVHCGSAFEPDASGLPYYCTPTVCVPDVLDTLALWRLTKQKTAKYERSQETSRRGCNVGPSLLSVGGTRRPKVLGRGWRTYRCSMRKYIGIGAGAVVEKDRQVKGLGGLVQDEGKRRGATPGRREDG